MNLAFMRDLWTLMIRLSCKGGETYLRGSLALFGVLHDDNERGWRSVLGRRGLRKRREKAPYLLIFRCSLERSEMNE